jgi:hypothetical protein
MMDEERKRGREEGREGDFDGFQGMITTARLDTHT